MSAREGREGEGGKGIEGKETKGGEERMLRREGEGNRNNRTSCAFFVLLCFHCNLIVEMMISMPEKFFLDVSAKGRSYPSRQPVQAELVAQLQED